MVEGIEKGEEFDTAIANAQAKLPKRKKKGKGWYAEAADVLQPLIDARNDAYVMHWKERSVKSRDRLRRTRKVVKGAKKRAQERLVTWTMRDTM